MDEVEFDKFADEYRAMHAANIRLSGEEPEYFAEYKVIDIAAELARANVAPRRALDFGAGVGYSVPFFARHLPAARVTCLDVSRKSLDVGAARHRRRGRVHALRRPHDSVRRRHVRRRAWRRACSITSRTTSTSRCSPRSAACSTPGGALFVFEHNPLNPLTRHAVNTCEFDEHAKLVLAPTMRRRVRDAGFAAARIRYRIFFPHALRRLRPLERS